MFYRTFYRKILPQVISGWLGLMLEAGSRMVGGLAQAAIVESQLELGSELASPSSRRRLTELSSTASLRTLEFAYNLLERCEETAAALSTQRTEPQPGRD